MANVLNVRQKPSMNSRVILQLPADARWIVKRTSEKQGAWQKVVWGVKEGWVYNSYLGEDPKATQFLTEHRQCVKNNPRNSMCCGFKGPSERRNSAQHEIRTFMVVNVPRGQSLNVRASGSASSKKIANIPHNAVGVVKFPGKQLKNGRATWQKIRWNGRDGWVNTSYLKYDPIISDYRNIVQQSCSK
ncbi:MAG: SH3 domain-containing protein [Thiotrichaceae bacterium]